METSQRHRGEASRTVQDRLPERLPPHPPLARYYADEQERQRQVSRWFDESAARYDFITQAMSFGSGNRYRQQALLQAGLGGRMSPLDIPRGPGGVAAPAQDILGVRGL